MNVVVFQHELRNPLQVLTVAIDSLREAFVDRHISKRFAQYRTASSSNRSLLADQSSMTAISMGPDPDTAHSNTPGPAFASTPELLSMAGTSVQVRFAITPTACCIGHWQACGRLPLVAGLSHEYQH